MKNLSKGFTLIELMIVVAIIAIIAAIAIPAYSDYVTRARRADAKNVLLMIQLAEEKWRANNSSYGTLANIGISAVSPDEHYNIVLATVSTSGATSSSYTATATATGVQAGDTLCPTFVVTNIGVSGVQSYIKSCWNR